MSIAQVLYLENGDWKEEPKTDWMVRGCSGDEGEPRWKLFELKLGKRRVKRQACCGPLPKEGRRLCIGIMDDVVVNNASECTTRSGWRGDVLGRRK